MLLFGAHIFFSEYSWLFALALEKEKRRGENSHILLKKKNLFLPLNVCRHFSRRRRRKKSKLTLFQIRPRNPTTYGGMRNGSSVGICTGYKHVFARLASILHA